MYQNKRAAMKITGTPKVANFLWFSFGRTQDFFHLHHQSVDHQHQAGREECYNQGRLFVLVFCFLTNFAKCLSVPQHIQELNMVRNRNYTNLNSQTLPNLKSTFSLALSCLMRSLKCRVPCLTAWCSCTKTKLIDLIDTFSSPFFYCFNSGQLIKFFLVQTHKFPPIHKFHIHIKRNYIWCTGI